jgi:hypothetical protein
MPRIVLTRSVILIGIFLATTVLGAALTFPGFKRLVEKYVKPDNMSKNQAICFCTDEDVVTGKGFARVGVLKQFTVDSSGKGIEVQCMVQFFGPGDTVEFEKRCLNFVPFAR